VHPLPVEPAVGLSGERGVDVSSRYVTTIRDRHGVAHPVVLARDSEGIWLARCRLPGQEPLDGTSPKRRDAVGIVERKLIRATGGGRIIGQYRTCDLVPEASNVVPLRRR
jgi:hypothetical protein